MHCCCHWVGKGTFQVFSPAVLLATCRFRLIRRASSMLLVQHHADSEQLLLSCHWLIEKNSQWVMLHIHIEGKCLCKIYIGHFKHSLFLEEF